MTAQPRPTAKNADNAVRLAATLSFARPMPASLAGGGWQLNRFVAGAVVAVVVLLTVFVVAYNGRAGDQTVAVVPSTGDVASRVAETSSFSAASYRRSYHLVVRSFAGEANVLKSVLLPSLLALFDFRHARLTFLLDEESAADHAVGEDLVKLVGPLGAHVAYAPPPPDRVLNASPFKAGHDRYAGPGYARQLYDTFRLDTLLPAGTVGPYDVIGILDADSPLNSVLYMPSYLDAEDRVHHPSVGVDFWPGTPTLLGLPSGAAPHNPMASNAMPQLFHVSTFVLARAHIARTWKCSTFEEAWLKAYEGPAPPLTPEGDVADRSLFMSPANVLLNFGALLEPGGKYVVHPAPGPSAMAVLALNKGSHIPARVGCCRTFFRKGEGDGNASGEHKSGSAVLLSNTTLNPWATCTDAMRDDFEHITTVSFSQWDATSRKSVADEAYRAIARHFKTLGAADVERMRRGCENLLSSQ
jgi:hypothetical protein